MPEPHLQTSFSSNPEEYAAYIIDKYEKFIRCIIRTQNTTKIPEEDLFQDFFLELISKPVPHDIRDIKGYLYIAIINHLADSYARLNNYEKKIKKFQKNSNFKAPQNDPRTVLLMKEEMSNLLKYLKIVLPKKKYMAIAFRYRDGYSINEVAEKMGIKYSTVKKYISKGLGKVRQDLINT